MNMERLTWWYWWGNNWQLAKISSTTPTLKKSRETVCNINKIKRVWRQQFKAHFFFFFILSTFSHVLYTATKVVNHPFHNPTFRRVLWLHRQHASNCNVTKFNTLNKLVMWWKNGVLTCWYPVRLHLYFYSTTNTAPLRHCFYLIGHSFFFSGYTFPHPSCPVKATNVGMWFWIYIFFFDKPKNKVFMGLWIELIILLPKLH